MQRLLVLCILTLARRIFSNDGLSISATVCLDKLPHTTELGLSVWSLFKKGALRSLFVYKKDRKWFDWIFYVKTFLIVLKSYWFL